MFLFFFRRWMGAYSMEEVTRTKQFLGGGNEECQHEKFRLVLMDYPGNSLWTFRQCIFLAVLRDFILLHCTLCKWDSTSSIFIKTLWLQINIPAQHLFSRSIQREGPYLDFLLVSSLILFSWQFNYSTRFGSLVNCIIVKIETPSPSYVAALCSWRSCM